MFKKLLLSLALLITLSVFANEHWSSKYYDISPITSLPPKSEKVRDIETYYWLKKNTLNKFNSKHLGIKVNNLNKALAFPSPIDYPIVQESQMTKESIVKHTSDWGANFFVNRQKVETITKQIEVSILE